ncbi:MAG: ATP-binding protein [Candidatus Cloacimonetes bacterium]|nr:ATP-binding protein [Candidatus Cloacimonadota bacterium]
MFINRVYSNIKDHLQKGKVLIVFGPRQVGKTTIVSKYYDSFAGKKIMLNGDNIIVREQLGSQNQSLILGMFEGYQLLIIDEAQRIPNIGFALKMLVDNRPELQIIATGSSSFELAGQVGEPLTGRKNTLMLYPIWLGELLEYYNRYELNTMLPDFLVYGLYPEVVTSVSKQAKAELLMEITSSYLLKDILEMDKVKSAQPVINLLRMLSFQVGQEVSYNELSNKLGLDNKTISRYLDLFEKTHIIIKLSGFSRNLRNEITSKAKYYFYDNGIRNALIANFNPLELRDDIGLLWENFLIVERIKKRSYNNIYANQYFWRTWSQQEIDLIEEREGKLFAYEFKWKTAQVKIPPKFAEAYPKGLFSVINTDNHQDFIM